MTRRQGYRILKYAAELCEAHVRADVKVVLLNKVAPGDGTSYFTPGGRRMALGHKIRWLFRSENTHDVVEFCVAAGHELRHLEQCGLADSPLGAPVPVDASISQLAVRHNQIWYKWNGKKNHVSEADAEHFGFLYGFAILSSTIGAVDAEKLLVGFCNESIAHPGDYYLKLEDCGKFPLENLGEIDQAFQNAMTRCKLEQKAYNNFDRIGFGDEFFDIMRRGRADVEDCLNKFIQVNHDELRKDAATRQSVATLQDGMACLSLYLHPEYLTEYPVNLSDLTAENVFGSPFQETAKDMLRYMSYVREEEIKVRNPGVPLVIPDEFSQNGSDRTDQDDDSGMRRDAQDIKSETQVQNQLHTGRFNDFLMRSAEAGLAAASRYETEADAVSDTAENQDAELADRLKARDRELEYKFGDIMENYGLGIDERRGSGVTKSVETQVGTTGSRPLPSVSSGLDKPNGNDGPNGPS